MNITLNNNKIELPVNYDLDERIDLVNQILDEHSSIFRNDDVDNTEENKIQDKLDTLSYYLCTSKRTCNDKFIMRNWKLWKRKVYQEIPLWYAFSDNWNDYVGNNYSYTNSNNRGRRKAIKNDNEH